MSNEPTRAPLYYRLRTSDLPRDTAVAALRKMRERFGSEFEGASGASLTRPDGDGAYWVGVSSVFLGGVFQGFLGEVRVPIDRHQTLPGGRHLRFGSQPSRPPQAPPAVKPSPTASKPNGAGGGDPAFDIIIDIGRQLVADLGLDHFRGLRSRIPPLPDFGKLRRRRT